MGRLRSSARAASRAAWAALSLVVLFYASGPARAAAPAEGIRAADTPVAEIPAEGILIAGIPVAAAPAAEIPADGIPPNEAARIRAAAPERPTAAPRSPRRVLIWSTPPHLMEDDPHKGYCVPYGLSAFRALGEKTGAFEPIVVDDVSAFAPESLRRFDAIVLNNSCGPWIVPDEAALGKLRALGSTREEVEQALRRSLVEYVEGGGGIVAVHFAIGANSHWPGFRELLGAAFTGHPWNEEVAILNEEPGHPLLAAFGGKGFRIADEIYQFGAPYDRSKLRVLLSLDTEGTDMTAPWIDRTDDDFAQVWVKRQGKGRIFYSGFGHRTEVWWNPTILRFYLDAIQFAAGDLEAPADPRPDRPVRRSPGPEAIPTLFARRYKALEAARPAPPATPAEHRERTAALRLRHARALGVEPEHTPAPVSWKATGDEIRRDGYVLRKIIFESRPGLPVPAHLYVPTGVPGPFPAVLAVHGHWKEAKAAPAVQLRNIFLAQKGYLVLALDAIGAGERAWRDPEKGIIGYHGRQLGYGVLPSGLTLAGLQVEDNRRALDLLASLPEVDAARIGVTGASGGGNQTFHISILDGRVRAAVPVCFFGAFRGYLEGAHCACELVPGILRSAEEGDLAGTAAPRPMMVIAAIQDGGAAFRIEDARRSMETARRWAAALGSPETARLLEFACEHDYNQDMREAMVAFFDRKLRGIDSGDRVPQPPIAIETEEALRCFGPEGPGLEALTVPRIAADRVRDLAAAFRAGGGGWADPAARGELRRRLRDEIFGGFPSGGGVFEPDGAGSGSGWLPTEPRVAVRIEAAPWSAPAPPRRILIHLPDPFAAGPADAAGADGTPGAPVAPGAGTPDGPGAPVAPDAEAGASAVLTATARLRGTGPTVWPAASMVDCPDYLLAQGSAVLGRPMLGQWTYDAIRTAASFRQRFPGAQVGICGSGVMGTVAVLAAVLDDEIAGAASTDALSSYGWPGRFADRWPLSLFAPGIAVLGDLPDMAAGLSPRPLVLASPRDGGGAPLDGPAVERLQGLIDGAVRKASGPAGTEARAAPAPIAILPSGTAEEAARALLATLAPKATTSGAWWIAPLHTGLCSMGKNHLLGDPFTDEERVPFALISFLLEGPGGKRAIVDFGPKDPAYFNECFRRYGLFRERCGDKEHPDDVVQPEGNVLDHLGRLGIGTGSIDHIIFTHLHYDHVGGSRPPDAGLLWDFPGALVHVSRRGWEDNLARRADGWRWTSYVDFEISQEIFVRGNEGRARMADEEEILPGLRTRYLGGHSVCSQAVLVDTAEGTAVIAGDVVYRYEYLAEGIVARLRTTPEEYAEAVDRVVRLVEESGGVLVPVHDPKILEAWRKAGPGWLAELRPESDRALRAFRDRGGGRALRVLEAHRNKG